MQNSENAQNEPASAQMERDSYDLPSHDALSKILLEYLHLVKKPKTQTRTESVPQKKSNSQLNRTFDVHSAQKSPSVPDFKNDPHVGEVTEHQTKELENYRAAMHKMADDIIGLRSQVSRLESENSQLRHDLSLHQDLGHTLLDDTDTDVMTKTEIADRIASLKFKLSSESSKAAAQKDRIQQLQNELIRKNDIEKEFVQLQRAHQQQQAVLKRYQARGSKITALEDTVRQQEKVIEKMEKILDAKLKERNKENSDKKRTAVKHKDEEELKRREIESVLAAENSRLRAELDRQRNLPPPVIIQQPVQPFSDSEKLDLLTQLARAEGRIQTLEQQLKENSRQWGKEKQEMLTRLSEYEHGFARTSTMILLDLPVKSVTESVLGHSRHRQLEPLK
ncbi:coiled-coil domain-containing protein 33 [Ctenopharyngodon idella]|uniref:coiled-coil domain-containing protein 33 n=1 Tax=Ctenopharyngodon idella TaxID=7959 RepID=UPI002232718A|nr:coiled-coil domain-containing protein 33 [Ctenopharyngodon idella]XP_051740903.1 coiled-coil domain-containing protein 33 [Ctenopharyngodon idella]XP_051740904.1 coiled-coil domain-containing protein 33 [Ctenopharyngodon idella]XP_051740905.1 coiled-coil domain-containing protein 33 [Ctenopharyngodon idella]